MNHVATVEVQKGVFLQDFPPRFVSTDNPIVHKNYLRKKVNWIQ